MSSLSVDTRLMALLPLLLAGLLVGTALIGSLLPPMAKGWIVRWLFLPLNFCLSAGMLVIYCSRVTRSGPSSTS